MQAFAILGFILTVCLLMAGIFYITIELPSRWVWIPEIVPQKPVVITANELVVTPAYRHCMTLPISSTLDFDMHVFTHC